MTLPGKLLLAASITASLVFTAGYAAQHSTSRELDRLHFACLEQDKQQKLRSPSSSFTLDCDPRSLTATDDKLMRRYEEALGGSTPVEYHPSPGVQGDMVRAQRRLNLLRRITVPVAIIVAVTLALPWLWYFLLDRLREARQALAR